MNRRTFFLTLLAMLLGRRERRTGLVIDEPVDAEWRNTFEL